MTTSNHYEPTSYKNYTQKAKEQKAQQTKSLIV